VTENGGKNRDGSLLPGMEEHLSSSTAPKAESHPRAPLDPATLRRQLEEDAVHLGQPLVALLFVVGTLALSQWWEGALGLLILPAGWAVLWVLTGGIPKALAAVFRIPYNLIRLRQAHNNTTEGRRGAGSPSRQVNGKKL